MNKSVITMLIGSAFFLISCGEGDKKVNSSEQTSATQVDNELDKSSTNTSSNLLADTKLLQDAENSLKNLPQFKGKEIKIFQKVYFYEDGRIILSIQDPSKPENIDEYKFQNGKWQEPIPMQISGDGDMDSNIFSLNTIKFETVANINKQTQDKTKDIEGAEPLSSIFYAMNPATGEYRWLTSIQATRGSYTGIYNADGTLKSFEKD